MDILQQLAGLGIKTNANDVMHTANAGAGKELIPTDVLSKDIIEMIPEYSRLLPFCKGDHGVDMPISEKVPVIGKTGKFKRNTEWSEGAPTGNQANKKQATAQVTITQGQFIDEVALSKRQLNYSVADLEALVKKALAQGGAQTVDAFILNADSTTGATGNVNSDDQAPVGDEYFLEGDNGIRKLGLASSPVTVGTMDFSDFLNVAKGLGRFSADRANCLWVLENETYLKALGIDEFKKANENGQNSTIHTGAVTNILGSDLITLEDFGKTAVDGKIDLATPANNTKGGFGYIYLPAIQFGYGQVIDIEATKVAGKGIQLTATFEFGFTIVQKLAGVTDSSVSLGIGVDL